MFERYPLEIVRLTSTHKVGPETQLLYRVWTTHSARIIQGEWRWDGACLLIAPQLSPHVLEFTLVNERVSSLGRSLSVVCVYEPKPSTRPSWPPVEQWSPQLEHYQVPLTIPFFY